MKIAGLILAAGASRRLGRAKQAVMLGGESLLERAGRVALEAGLDPVLVVVAEEGLGWEQRLEGCRLILNPEAAEGMAASIRVGVGAASEAGAEGVVAMACDQPAVTAEHLRALMQGGLDVVASAYAGRRGVPAYFPATAYPELLALRGDVGARELLGEAACVDLPGGELDIDTEVALERARALFVR